MDNSKADRTPLLPNATRTSTSLGSKIINVPFLRPIVRLFRKSSGVDNDLELMKTTRNSNVRSVLVSPDKYGYLEHILSYKDLCRPDDNNLSKKVRNYYKDQLDFINSIEATLLPMSTEAEGDATTYQKRRRRMIHILSMTCLFVNIILVLIKIVCAVISQSLSVFSSLVDSGVDLIGIISLIWAADKIKTRNIYLYPAGRKRLEPVVIVILSVIMCSANVEVIIESSKTLYQDIDYFANRHNASSTKTLPYIDMNVFTIAIMIVTIMSNTILMVLCYQIKDPTMHALAIDCRNDVAANIVALACGTIGSNALHKRIQQEAIVVDPIGAILISSYIIVVWTQQAKKQVRQLTGLAAEISFVQRITHFIYNFRPNIIIKINSIRAVHFDTNVSIEVNIALPGSMPLAIAHEIGTELRKQLEKLDAVEDAIVHLDFLS